MTSVIALDRCLRYYMEIYMEVSEVISVYIHIIQPDYVESVILVRTHLVDLL